MPKRRRPLVGPSEEKEPPVVFPAAGPRPQPRPPRWRGPIGLAPQAPAAPVIKRDRTGPVKLYARDGRVLRYGHVTDYPSVNSLAADLFPGVGSIGLCQVLAEAERVGMTNDDREGGEVWVTRPIG